MRRFTLISLASFSLLATGLMPSAYAQSAGSTMNAWTQTASLTAPRSQACAAVLNDGRVLVAGGLGVSGPVASVDIYNADGTFTAGVPMTHARAAAACITLNDGRVLVTGGDDGSGSLNTAEIFNPAANQWQATGNLNVAREGHQIALTTWGNVWIAGGAHNGALVGQVELYFPATGNFQTVGALNTPRSDFAMASMGRNLVIAGGTDGTNVLGSVEVYDSSQGTISVAGTMSQPRKDFAAAGLPDGTVLMTGGVDGDGTTLSTTEVFNLTAGTSVKGPALLAARAYHTAFALPNNGSVLIYGGVGNSGVLGTTEVYAPWSGAITQGAPLNSARRNEAKALLRPGGYLIAGGQNDVALLNATELYQFATITTDKGDYHPGTPVKIAGGGWVPGEQVLVTIQALPMDQHHIEFTGVGVADGAGNITVPGFAVDKSHLGVKFLMTAAGSQSEAQTTFSDGIDPIISYAFNPVSGATPGSTLSVTVTLTPPSGADPTPTGSVIPCTNNTCPTTLTVTGTGSTSCGAGDVCAVVAGSGNTAVATFNLSNIPGGQTVFSVDYSGDSNYNFEVPMAGTTPPGAPNVTYQAENFTSTYLTGGPTSPAVFDNQTAYVANVCTSGTTDVVPCNDIAVTLTGSVQFFVSGGSFGGTAVAFGNPVAITANPSNGTGTANLVPGTTPGTSPLPVGGPYTITATYSDPNNVTSNSASINGGSASIQTTIIPIPTTWNTPTQTNPNGTNAVFGGPLTIQGSLTSTSLTPDGSVQFVYDVAAANSTSGVSSTSGATAFFNNSPSTTVLGGGAHTVHTTGYTSTSGDFAAPTVNPSGTLNFTINPAPAAFTITSSNNAQPVVVTSVVTFTATYTGGLSPAPTGNVNFVNSAAGNAAICTGTLNAAGVASCNATAGPGGAAGLQVGPVTVTITYAGDNNYTLGTVTTTSFSVVKATTTTALAATLPDGGGTFAYAGHKVTLTATVTITNAPAPIAGEPTAANITITPPAGNVLAGTSTCGTPTVVQAGNGTSAIVSCTFVASGPVPAAGVTANATASYATDAYTLASGPSAANVPLQQDPTTTTLTYTSSEAPNPTFIGHTITLTATVTNTIATTAPGAQILPNTAAITVTPPPGNFSSTTCGTPTPGAPGANFVTVSCTFVLSGPLGTGTIQANASYNGDTPSGTAASAATALNITIQDAATSTTINSVTSADSPNPTQYGRTVTINVTVATTTAGSNLQPTQGNITITPPAGNSSNSTCATPTLQSSTATSVTVTCTFLLTGTSAGPNPASVTINASYAANNTVGTAASVATAFNLSVVKATTTTTLTASAPPDATTSVQLGRVVTLTATASTQSNVAVGPSGTFTFVLPTATFLNPSCGVEGIFDADARPRALPNNAFVVTPTAGNIVVTTNGVTTVTCTFTVVPPSTAAATGADAYSVTYNGDGLTLTSGNNTNITTVKDQTAITASATAPGTYVYGQTFTLTGTLTSTTGLPADGATYAPTQSVTFSGQGLNYSAPIVPSSTGGTAAVTSPAGVTVVPVPGAYNLNVAYPSTDPYYGPSNTTVSFIVIKANTTTVVTPIKATFAGQPDLAIGVGAAAPGSGVPTGTVQIFINGGLVTTVPLSATNSPYCPPGLNLCGLALVSLPTATGYSAAYSGDTNFNVSTSAPSQQVTGVVATTTLTVTATPAVPQPNQQVTLVATVNGTNGALPPTGTVTFTDNGTVICNGAVPVIATPQSSSPTATCVVTFGPGPQNIVATYSGDLTYPSASFSLGVSVTRPQPAAAFSSNLTTAVYGQQVTLAVKLTSATTGVTAIPSGTVQFTEDGNPVGNPVTLVNGSASLPTSALPVGVLTIGIVYTPDSASEFAGLTKTSFPNGTITITQGQTTITLAAPTITGNQMTLTATVSVVSPAAGTPTGTVTFTDTATQASLGTAPLSSGGVASTTVAATTDPVIAVYSGDTNFLGSTSASTQPTAAISAILNAADYTSTFAPDEIVTVFGVGLASQTVTGSLPLTTSLGGDTVTVTDSAGVPRQGLFFYVSPSQMSFLIPAGTAPGAATVVITTPSGSLTTTITVTASAAALFTANDSGSGPLAAQVVTVTPSGQETYANTAALSSPNSTTFVNAPISLSPSSDSFYLLLYGTGFDNAQTVTVTINGQTFTPSYFGPQGTFQGLDQANVLLPASLIGAGQVNVTITVDGALSNVGTIAFASAGTN